MSEIKLIEDKANKEGKHEKKNAYWKSQGIEVVRYGLPVADYILVNDKVQDLLDRKEKRGIAVKKMDFLGTYDVAVDSKQSMLEICGNLCGKAHDRFRDEMLLACNNGIKLYILIEDDGGWVSRKKNIQNKPVTCVDDVFHWVNPRLWIWQNGKQKYPYATKGTQLAKVMKTCEARYGCEFVFCQSEDAGAKIIELLTKDNVNER